MAMRRSFVRLIVGSVLASWAVCMATLVVYVRSRSWIDDRARGDGVFLARQLLATEAPDARAMRLEALAPNFSVPLRLMERADVERRLGRTMTPGEAVPLRVSPTEEWYFLAFEDTRQVLAVGPVSPSQPPGAIPIGVFMLILGLPIIGSVIAYRIERQLMKVEAASEALAVGELSARVEAGKGANELATTFNAMAERIERLVRDRDELVQAVSHELGLPLSRLRFHLELLDGADEARAETRVAAMAAELDALEALVAELLGYVQTETRAMDRTRFDPRQGLEHIAELASLDLPDEREIEVEVEQAGDLEVYADRRQFERAIENLIRNAVRYGHSTVRVRVEAVGAEVQVAVHDDGPGIPEAMRERVLQPFVRLDEDRGRETGGVGLGLAIVGRIVRRHGGRLAIETSPLGGAAVETRWPVG